MQTIARHLTVALRTNDTTLAHQDDHSASLSASHVAPSHQVAGTVSVQIVLLHVRWGWLSFPAALLLLVAALLFETIRSSQPETVGVWKSNPLAVLLNTQWQPKTDMMGAATSDRLDNIAKDLEATVVCGGIVGAGARSVLIRRRHLS
jgi:hypothetical protein